MICQDFLLLGLFITAAFVSLMTPGAECQVSADTLNPAPFPVYPSVDFQILNMDHLLLRDSSQDLMGNASLQSQSQAFLVTSSGRGAINPSVNATYGPLSTTSPIPSDLLLSGRRILPVILARQVRSSAPVVRILFHLPTGGDIAGRSTNAGRQGAATAGKSGAHCVTAYAFWQTQEVRGACLVAPGQFCVAQLKPEPTWFTPAFRPASSKEKSTSDVQGNPVEIYFQSRSDRTGACVPQDSLQRVGVGRGGPQRSGTPMQRVGSVNLVKAPPGNPTFLRLRLGGAVVVQTSSKPLKTTDTATFYVFLSSVSAVESFTLRATVRKGLSFKAARPSDSALWDIAVDPGRGGAPNGGGAPNTISVVCLRKIAITGIKRGLLEILQLDFETNELTDQSESQMITWRLEMPGNVRDVGIMRIYTTQRNYVGLAPLVMNNDLLNTAVLTGQTVSVPIQTLAVEADGSVTDVTSTVSCRSPQEDTLKISERCDFVYVNGSETRGSMRMLLNFTYSYLSAQLEMNVWMPRLPLLIDVGDPELSQIKGWRVPVVAGSRRPTLDSEEEEEMRKGRGCMLQYQHTVVRVVTPFMAESSNLQPDPLGGAEPTDYFLGPDWQVDVTRLVRDFLRVEDPTVAGLGGQAGTTLQGRAMGTTTVQVLSPLSTSLLAERSIRVVDDKVSVTELGVQLVSGLSLSLQLSLGSNRAIVATATTQEVMTSLKQEAVVSCWVQFSDSSVTPLDLFDQSGYSLSMTSEDESLATVRRTPESSFVVAEGPADGVLVRVELRICEECQKSKRKSKLAVGTGLLRINIPVDNATSDAILIESDGENGFELAGELRPVVTSPRAALMDGDGRLFRGTVLMPRETTTSRTTTFLATTKAALQEMLGAGTATIRRETSTAYTERTTMATTTTTTTTITATTTTTTTVGNPATAKPFVTEKPAPGRAGVDKTLGKGNGQRREWANMADSPKPPPPKREKPKPPERKSPPRFVESDLIRRFRAMSDVQIGILCLVGVSCMAFLAFVFNCASYKLCFRGQKTPIQAHGPGVPGSQKHDWVWTNGPPGGPVQIPPQVNTQKRESHTSLESSLSMVSACPERTATLGRRSQSLTPMIVTDPMANRSQTLRPALRNEPLHSPTSKRNQVQFTTFTTLDIKHLAALKKNGVDFNWANQGRAPAQQQIPLPDMPWPVVRPIEQPRSILVPDRDQ